MVQTEYEKGTLREKLFGAGKSLLPDDHTGAKYRNLQNLKNTYI